MDNNEVTSQKAVPGSLKEPGNSVILLSGIGFVIMLFVFLFIVYYSYWPNRPLPVDLARVEERTDNLKALQQKQEGIATTYGWVDQSSEVVRIPIDRAMELTVRSLNKKQKDEDDNS